MQCNFGLANGGENWKLQEKRPSNPHIHSFFFHFFSRMQLGVQLRTEIISLVSSAAWCGILVYFETRFCHFSIFRFSVATDDGDAVFTMCDAYSNDQKTVVYRKSYMGTRIMHYVTVFIQLFHWITHIQYI